MAPRAAGKKGGKSGGEEKREDVLQAVVIVDSFQARFEPFAVETPRCLLPLGNTPLIEYTLEFLASNGVQEVFLYCGAHSNKVEKYISESRWAPTSASCPFAHLEFVRVADARSIGDFLRDLDSRNFIGGDFILVHGDTVANIPLDGALARHRARREANRDSCMTMVLREGGENEHRSKSKGITPIFAIDPRANRCLHYEEMHPLQSDRYTTLDPDILKQPEVDMRADLIDAQIDICTPDVLALWSESFDYELPRANFLHGVLKDFELNGKLIHTEIVSEGYTARANNLQMYEAITRDMLTGWTHPFGPSSNLLRGQTYRPTGDNVYEEQDVESGDNTDLMDCTFGDGTRIGSNTTIHNSILGRNCRIGNNVVIEDSVIWEGVTVGDGAEIQRSILADGVVVGKKSNIGEGSLLSFGVQISDETTIKPSSVISTISCQSTMLSSDPTLVGPNGKGAAYQNPEDDEVEFDDPSRLQKSIMYSLAEYNLSYSSISTFADDDLMSETDSDAPGGVHRGAVTSDRSRLNSFASDDSSGTGTGSTHFHADAVHGLLEALRVTGGDFDSEKLEFTSLRLANNASDAAMRRAIATAFVRRAAELVTSEESPLDPARASRQVLVGRKGAYGFVRDMGVGGDSVKDQVEFALAVQKACASSAKVTISSDKAGALLAGFLKHMYDLDVLEEEGILGWWDLEQDSSAEGGNSELMVAVKEKTRELVEWLRDAEEEGSSEEESD